MMSDKTDQDRREDADRDLDAAGRVERYADKKGR